MRKTKLIFFGTSDFVVKPLERLMEDGYEILAVIVVGNNSAVGKYANEHNLYVLAPQSLKENEFFEEFKNLEPEFCVVASYGKIIPQRYLKIPKFGFLNIHPSLLPKYRGPSPVPTALLAGDKITGVTIIKMDAEMDHGQIVAQQEVQIEPDDNFMTLIYRLFDISSRLLVDILQGYLNGKTELRSQDDSQATFTHFIKTEDAEINTTDTVQQAFNKIRALNPEPGTFTILPSGKRLKILEACRTSDISKPHLKLSDGIIELIQVQPEGRKPMTGQDWLRGIRVNHDNHIQ